MKELIEFLAKLRGTYEGLVDEWDIRHAAAEKIEAQQAETANLQALWTIAHNERSEALLDAAKLGSERDALAERVKVLRDAAKAAAEQIRKCDYTPARSTLLQALATGDGK